MKPLIKVMLILGAAFATTFILGRVLGILTVENVRAWLEWAGTINPMIVASLVVMLLFIDLFVAVPTLTITLLAGYFLGFPIGMGTVLLGMSLAALTGFGLSRLWGGKVVGFLIKEELQRAELIEAFNRHGPAMILLARAVPILPEVTACMAGTIGMGLARYLVYFSLGTLPYVAIATYAGSISDLDNPMPAIYAALFLCGVLWLGWYVFRRKRLRHQVVSAKAE